MYTIRDVDLDDTANFLGRPDMWDLAAADGLWAEGAPRDFTATFSDGEYGHQYYSGRRMWGAFRLVAPAFTATQLLPTYGNLKLDAPYPFAVAVEQKLSVAAVLGVMRDWYAGTPYDLSAGLAGGFGGSPDRYGGCGAGTNCSGVAGNWERPVALYRTSDASVVQARRWLPDAVGGTLWFGPHAAHGTVFVPLAAGSLAAPPEYTDGWQGSAPLAQQRATNGGFWASRAVLNVAQLRFDVAMPRVRAQQLHFEQQGLVVQAAADRAWLAAVATAAAADARGAAAADNANATLALTAAYLAHATLAVQAWWQLSDELLFALADGYLNAWSAGSPSPAAAAGGGAWAAPVFTASAVGYPSWWLEQVGYQNGPPPV
jgi:dipeptidase